MIERYARPEMARLWSDQSRLESWLEVELAVCEVMAARGEIPAADLAAIRERAGFDLGRVEALDREVGHDVIAFLTAVAERVGPAARHIHHGLTSSDVVDTAQALRTVRATDALIQGVERLRTVLRTRAMEHKRTVLVGRTHGVHAEPYTLGLKLAGWYAEAGRNLERLRAAREEMRHGKLSGAVGTYSHLPPAIESEVLARLGLVAEPIATQVVPRDRHAVFLATLGVLASSLDRIATEIRHLQRSEVREVEEPFARGQKGSSAMPHKRNPVKCENVSGLARIVRSHVQAALENVPLWHERDISHSAVERVILPDATILCDFMLERMTRIIEGLHVYPERMLRNLELTQGLVFSQAVLLALTAAGRPRDEAYAIVQRNAMSCWAGAGTFRELLAADPDVTATLSPGALEACFDAGRLLVHVEEIFDRVFGG